MVTSRMLFVKGGRGGGCVLVTGTPDLLTGIKFHVQRGVVKITSLPIKYRFAPIFKLFLGNTLNPITGKETSPLPLARIQRPTFYSLLVMITNTTLLARIGKRS